MAPRTAAKMVVSMAVRHNPWNSARRGWDKRREDLPAAWCRRSMNAAVLGWLPGLCRWRRGRPVGWGLRHRGMGAVVPVRSAVVWFGSIRRLRIGARIGCIRRHPWRIAHAPCFSLARYRRSALLGAHACGLLNLPEVAPEGFVKRVPPAPFAGASWRVRGSRARIARRRRDRRGEHGSSPARSE